MFACFSGAARRPPKRVGQAFLDCQKKKKKTQPKEQKAIKKYKDEEKVNQGSSVQEEFVAFGNC